MLRVQVGIGECDNAIIMSYFVEHPKYLHNPEFSLRKVIYFCLIVIKITTCPLFL